MEVLFPCGDLLLTCRRNQFRPLVADSFCGSSICGSVDALKAGADKPQMVKLRECLTDISHLGEATGVLRYFLLPIFEQIVVRLRHLHYGIQVLFLRTLRHGIDAAFDAFSDFRFHRADLCEKVLVHMEFVHDNGCTGQAFLYITTVSAGHVHCDYLNICVVIDHVFYRMQDSVALVVLAHFQQAAAFTVHKDRTHIVYNVFFVDTEYPWRNDWAALGLQLRAVVVEYSSDSGDGITVPSMEKQKRIAFFLDSIDKKIDNNNVISAELEGMAKGLYDYWFVQFDFPDENGKPYKSSGGKMVWNDELKREIPEGWENGIVSDLGTVVTGGTPSTGCAEYFAKSKSGHAWATPKDLSNLNGRYFYHGEADITDAGLKNSAGNIMPKGSVLFTTRAPIGYIAITANEACTNQGFKSIIPAKKFGTEFVFQTLKMLTPQMQRVGVGSTFKEVSKDVFSRQSIVIPSVNLLKKYAALTLDIAEKIRNTQEENVELTSLRDFLLPMLMNGQVKVKGA